MQNMKKFCLIIILSIISFIDIYAQENNSYELLWQIESEAQSAPSYLFGTMHVKDKRAFNFSDSVMTSIEKCEIFALEVEPDSIVGAMFGTMFESDTTDYLKDLLSADEYKRFKLRFKERTGYDYDDLDSKNPMILDAMIQPEFSKPDDKQSFVDAYLYGIAKTMNKKTTGLEDIRTQMDMFSYASKKEQREMAIDLLQYDTEDYEGVYDKMADLYSTGDIGLMADFFGPQSEDSMMVARNHVMANSMVRLMNENTTFAAVGTAHLWGEEGVIELLRKKGYTVSPVSATFTGVADKYKVDVSKMKWMTYRDEELGFTIEMPGKPFPIDMEEEMGMKMQMLMYPDISTEMNFAVMTVDFRELPVDALSDEQLMNLMVDGMKDTELADFKQKKMKRKDREGLQLFLKEKNGRASTMEMFVKNKILYAIFFEGKRQELKQPYIKRFFNSYKNTAPKPIEKKASNDWITYTNEIGAFSILLPGEPRDMSSKVEIDDDGDTYLVNTYMSINSATLTNYLAVYHDFPTGQYLEDRNGVFDLVLVDIKDNGAKLLGEVDTIFKEGIEGRKCNLLIQDKFYCELRLYLRGNRVYRLLKQNLNIGEQTLIEDDFFDSFTLLPPKAPEFEDFVPEDQNYSIKRFEQYITELDSTLDYEAFIGDTYSLVTTNPHTGGVYSFEASKIKPEYRLEHIDTFYNWYVDAIHSWQDSIVSDTPIKVEGKQGREVFNINKRTGETSRYRIWLDNDELFFISAYSDEKELFNETSNTYFNSFKKTGNNPPFDIYASKTKQILDGLQSTDTLVYQKYLGAIAYYEFIEEDLPLMYEAINLDYPDDSLQSGARSQIIENIAYVDKASSIDKLKKLYPQVNDIQKNTILGSLVDFSDEDKARDAVIELVLSNPPEELRYDWATFSYFSDSLDLGAQYFPQLLSLLEKEDYRDNILALAEELIQSDNTAHVSLIENSFDALMKYAIDDFQKYKKENEVEENTYFYDPTMWDYFALMERVKGKKITNEYTNLVLNTKTTNEYQKAEAASIRLINGFKTDKKLLKSQIKSIKTRYTMIEAYQKIGRLKEVPKKYRTPEAIAKLKLSEYVSDDWRRPDEMQVLGTIPTDSAKLYVIKLTFKYDGEIEHYLGLTGPFSASGEWDLDTLKAYASWEEEATENWQKAAKDMLEDFNND